MKIGYCRVSTKQQNLGAQVNLLKAHGIKSRNIFAEKYTGKTTKRPQFLSMLRQIRSGDQIVIVRLDRFARNLRQALNAIYYIKKRHCSLKVLYPFPMDVIKKKNGNYMSVNEDKVDMLLLFSQWERKAIIFRTTSGRKYKKLHSRSYRVGRFRRTQSKYSNFYKRIYNYSKSHTIHNTAEHFLNIHNGKANGRHISERTVCNIKNMYKNPKHYEAKLHNKRVRYHLLKKGKDTTYLNE